jgi:hypothetical protein
MAVFSDSGVLTARQKRPARDSESPAEARPEGERPYSSLLSYNKIGQGKVYHKLLEQKYVSEEIIFCFIHFFEN